MTASASGITLTAADIPMVLGMVNRGDRKQDIAAWFGVNPARIAEAIAGDYGLPPMVPANTLPPRGSPGVKGRRVRKAIQDALTAADFSAAKAILKAATAQYDKNER